ncbi:MAG: 50S ribosomal protein L10 [Candidatus Altiarchaeota archaeon]
MVAPWKKKEVDELAKKLAKAPVVGLVGVESIPSRQLQKMRKQFGSQLEMRIARNNVIKHAIKKAKIPEELGGYLKGPSALVFTEISPFKLDKLISDNKTKAPAKAGSTAPNDIVIPKGDTPFAPGPIIGELQAVGIKAKIQGGKIVVLSDSKVVSAGEEVSPQLAGVLARFGIEPVEIGLKLQAAIEAGVVYPGDVLHIDEAETLARITTAYAGALNLSLNAGIINSVTIPHFIRDMHVKAVNLAFNAGIYTKQTLEFMIGKAECEAKALKSRIPEPAVKDDKKKEAVKEPSPEEKAGESKEDEPEKAEDKPTKEEAAAPEDKKEKPSKEKKPKKDNPAEETKTADKAAEKGEPEDKPAVEKKKQ